ncbi:sucrose phosphorylase [Streptococcus acidominimus]|uniref:Sucrose phosphorylase n=1 Tax=Streptococcus acidominimus TaxID=1326 RepID=A0A1Q8ED28_STRAI|nr:sucrose phosphorylase [Streptococcus acidominimus]OLF49692.1 sucrose phosphorylase [Streptococcus acidominimus]SUN08543.1 glycosidase [Streptococcus acidominimus]
MKIKNQAMLITYSDSLGKNLKDLKKVLEGSLKDTVGGVHILPFFPSSGDRGFAPMDYTKVDPAFGDWEDIEALSKDYYLMFDFMINHISAKSPYFLDFLEKKDASKYADLFIRYKNFWPNGEPSQEDVDLIYKRKPRAPYRIARFADGSEEKVWCTFDEQQIDLDVTTETTRQFIKENLENLAKHGASIIRLDAFAYANKKIGTNCFFVEPDIWDMLHFPRNLLAPQGIEILPEIHEHYTIQQKIAAQDYYVYDFALPMLVLHALYSGNVNRLVHWMEICPRKQFTTLDTHDGIGVVDVKDLLTDEETEATREALYAQGANVKKIYSTEAYNNLDIYQINCTYYSALGNNDQAYLLARVLQCFAPGIPQIYYVGLLAGENDIELLESSKEGRNINRHYYDVDEIEREVQRPVVQSLFKLLKFRNNSPAFDGEFAVQMMDAHTLRIAWDNQDAGIVAQLTANLKDKTFEIIERVEGEELHISL